MKSLVEQIRDVLVPNESIGLVKNDQIFKLQPLMPVFQFVSMVEDMNEKGQQKYLEFINHGDTVIFNGVIYLKTKGLNFQGRLKEILTLYHNHIKKVVGDKKALIDVYEKVPAEDIANLTEDHVIFTLQKYAHNSNKGLAAIRYLDDYNIFFEDKVFKMPGCVIALRIDDNLKIDNPEVISRGGQYEHPFVYRDLYQFGQKICMGSFYNSKDKSQFDSLRFANNVNYLIKQAVQILITGYNRRVSPANGHLTDSQYKKYL